MDFNIFLIVDKISLRLEAIKYAAISFVAEYRATIDSVEKCGRGIGLSDFMSEEEQDDCINPSGRW